MDGAPTQRSVAAETPDVRTFRLFFLYHKMCWGADLHKTRRDPGDPGGTMNIDRIKAADHSGQLVRLAEHET